MVYHSDEILQDIGFSLTGLLPMHCLYWNFDTMKIGHYLVQSHFSEFQEPCIF